MDLAVICCEAVELIHLVLQLGWCRALVNAVMYFPVALNVLNFWNTSATVASTQEIYPMEIVVILHSYLFSYYDNESW